MMMASLILLQFSWFITFKFIVQCPHPVVHGDVTVFIMVQVRYVRKLQ